MYRNDKITGVFVVALLFAILAAVVTESGIGFFAAFYGVFIAMFIKEYRIDNHG